MTDPGVDVREVPLSRGLVALVDSSDFAAVMVAGPWRAYKSGNNVYAVRCTRELSQAVSMNNTSGFRGVSCHTASRSWQAKIRVNRQVHSLRYHKTAEAAARAYDTAARELHGPFATLNFPPDGAQ